MTCGVFGSMRNDRTATSSTETKQHKQNRSVALALALALASRESENRRYCLGGVPPLSEKVNVSAPPPPPFTSGCTSPLQHPYPSRRINVGFQALLTEASKLGLLKASEREVPLVESIRRLAEGTGTASR